VPCTVDFLGKPERVGGVFDYIADCSELIASFVHPSVKATCQPRLHRIFV
jgi:hypothetical protein